MARYGSAVCMCQRMPDALSDALGNQVYIARFTSKKEIEPYFSFVCEQA